MTRSWIEAQLRFAVRASKRLGIDRHMTFPGALLWPYPQWPEGLVNKDFGEFARYWALILNDFNANGVDVCYGIPPKRRPA